MRTERTGLSRHAPVARAMDYMVKCWNGFARFLDDGRMSDKKRCGPRNTTAGLGRRAWLFAGSDQGGRRAAAIYTLIGTAKLNNIDPQAWLADVFARIADTPQSRPHELLPGHWKAEQQHAIAP